MPIMQNKKKNAAIFTYLGIGVFFLVFSALYFYPLLQGKILVQGDIMNFTAVSKETVDQHEKTGEAAQWTNSMFGGMPTYQVAMYNSGNLFEQVNKFLGMYLPRPANYMFIALICFFVMLRSFKVGYWLAAAGALCYALGTYLITFMEAGHNTKVHALALMPLVFAGIQILLRGNLFIGMAVTLFAMACHITANHPQITYYMLLMIACWMISELVFAWKEKKIIDWLKKAGLLVAITLFAVGANTSKLWTTYEYSHASIRGGSELSAQKELQDDGLNRDYAFSWSSGIAESFSIMFSNFAGGGSGRSFLQTKEGEPIDSELLTYVQQVYQQDQNKAQELLRYSGQAGKYWGDMPFTSGPIYVGTILCFLFVLGAFLARDSMRWWLIAATVLSLFLGWGKHFPAFNNFMFDYFPLYNKFRTVSMAMTMLCFTIPLMAFYITNKFLHSDNGISTEKKWWALKWSAITVGGISVILLMTAGQFDLTSPAEEAYLLQVNDIQTSTYFDLLKDARAGMIRQDIFISLVFIALAALSLWMFLKQKISAKIAILAICILPVLDLMIVDANYLGKSNYAEGNYYEQRFRQSLPVIKDKDPHFRVLNTMVDPDKDGITSYLYKSVGGYHGAKMQRYQDLIDGYISKGNVQVLSMLNTKYIIGSRQGKVGFDRNPLACGNAWFVDSIAMVETPDAEYAGLATFDPKQKALVHASFKDMLPATVVKRDTTATIRLKSYGMDEISYISNSNTAMPAIFSEIYYRGNEDWKAYIDNKYVPHFRADYVLRGLWVPEGEHTIVFKFEPRSYHTGKNISMAFSGLILLLCAGGGFMGWRKMNTTKENTTQN